MTRELEPLEVLILNAGLAQERGNSQVLCEFVQQELRGKGVACAVANVASIGPAQIAAARALVFVTGTYWSSWSSVLQAFLERMTETEGTSVWLGKPVVVLVSAHQVGAFSVLCRLQGVLCALGCSVPPMTGVVITRVGERVRLNHPDEATDVWGLPDVRIALHNLLEAVRGSRDFRAWNSDREHFEAVWLQADPETGSG
ncbi:MAG TPA: NAD(P)H-dependent oxidoreductase [Polyangiaceae bacterium]|nr:NAD(P)H-dependent oxidoreductase [Polyangiaceae bacterium]